MLSGLLQRLLFAVSAKPFRFARSGRQRALVGGDSLAPHELTRYAPVFFQILARIVIPEILAKWRYELKLFAAHGFATNLEQLGRVDKPLLFEHGLNYVARSTARWQRHSMVLARLEQVELF